MTTPDPPEQSSTPPPPPADSDASGTSAAPDAAPAGDDYELLSTLNKDGSRNWLRPRISTGRLLNARRVVGWALIVIFTVMPWLRIRGLPPILLDLPKREFTFFGTTFLPTDTLLVALFMLSIFVAIFLVTALFGRLWCGWACPQTVYMELLYRPIERFFEGPAYRSGGKKPISGFRRVAKHATFLVLSAHLANTFIAYFVGTDQMIEWTRQSPLEHPTGFLIFGSTTLLMMLDFGFLREQVCTLMCPYGRFQSVMLDRQSLIIKYDDGRGEPRGRKKRGTADDKGDCIDCHMCVTTCPTGIDIRKGLQMECINCAQCIDACNTVMDSIGTPRGLIRYSSQEAMETGRRRFIRPRIFVYPSILAIVLTGFILVLVGRGATDVWFQVTRNASYKLVDDGGAVQNLVLIKITNRTREPKTYTIELDAENAVLTSPDLPITIAGGADGAVTIMLTLPRDQFARGRANIEFAIIDETGEQTLAPHHVPGPLSSRPAS